MRGRSSLWVLLAGCVALYACSGDGENGSGESIGGFSEALTTAQSRVLGFETPTADWTTNAGTLSSSTTRSQGAQSLGIRPNGWTELTSIPLSSLGNVNSTFRYDVRIPSLPVWGETRVILMAPSRGIYWAELGSRDLRTLPVNSFSTVTFTIPPALESVLDGAYNDLRIKIVVNAQTLAQPYLIDNIVLASAGGTGGTGGTAGTGGAAGSGGTAGTSGSGGTGPGTQRTFTILRPQGVAIADTFISATDHVSIFSQAVVGVSGKTPAVASFGSSTQTYLQAQARAFANVYSVPNVQLDAKTRVSGFIRTRGTISKQGVGADAPVVSGGEFTNTSVLPTVMSWSVTEPTTNSGNVEFFAVPTIQNHVVPPGSYARFNVHDRNRIFLSSGVYFFHSFSSEPLAEIYVNKTNGPIVIYVRDSFNYKGRFVENGGPVGRVIVGYSGTSDAFLQAPFTGTMVAPRATIKLERPTSGQHRGSFYGKGVEVASGPLHTVLHEPFNFDFLCARGDTDADGTLDCTDICEIDPTKVTPGMCGCNIPETDGDGDGAPNCIDECPYDATAQFRGTCGCPSDPAPNGTACFDSPCRGEFACNAGLCGDPNSCRPDPSCQLRYLPTTRHFYWFCSAAVGWDQARTICGSVDGMKLAQIDGEVENAFISRNLNGAPSWTGANDLDTEGEWFWKGFGAAVGEQFWTGGPGGRRYFARFSAWSGGSPPSGAPSCARIDANGLWDGAACNALSGFVCELGLDRTQDIDFPTITPTCEVLGIDCNPGDESGGTPGIDCELEADEFGDLTEGEVLDAFSNCKAACENGQEGTPACVAACTGPATPPADTDVCDDANDFPLDMTSCGESTLVPGPIPCDVAADCPDDALCSREYPGGGAGQPALCVVPSNNCPTPPDFPERCREVTLCEPEEEQIVTTVEGPGTDLSEQPFVPLDAFGPPVTAPQTPYPVDDDPCGGSCVGRGQGHPWCLLGAADPTPPRDPVAPARHGDTGGDLISFHFDPKFTLTHSADIGAFGLPKLDVKAEAGVSAGVTVGIPGVPSFDIIDLLVALEADQCGISRSEQTADILGVDFIALADLGEFGVPVTFPDAATRTACQDAYRDFENGANRAKKALRDTVELIQQYKDALADDATTNANRFTNNLRADLCRQIASATPRGFPPGNCPLTGPTESPEATINRFIEYYRRSVLGFAQPGIKGLLEVGTDLKNAAKAELGADVAFTIFTYGNTQEDTIASAQFFIGPIPVFLDVTSTVQYGVDLKGRAGFNAGPVVDAILRADADMPAEQVAFVGVEGAPYAGAGLGLFAGVGFGVPGFKVKIGMAADLHLGTVMLPAYAGAGIGLGAEIDGRPAPADLGPISTGVNLVPAKRFVADLRFKAGLGVKVRDLLTGSISGKLKISVLFFSKSWKKTLFKFTGICAGDPNARIEGCDFDLITFNGSTDAASGSFPWAEIRMPTTFPQLSVLTPAASTPGAQSVDLSVVEEFFYDGQCDCIDGTDAAETRVCVRDQDCCDNTPNCFTDPVSGQNSCIDCRSRGETCAEDADCCGVPNSLCNTITGTCEGKLSCTGPCTRNDECVSGQQCVERPANSGTFQCFTNGSPCVIF
jgi:hypothetical protein